MKRCDVCGWPLAEFAADGCVPGNCSMRPRPRTTYAESMALLPPIGTRVKLLDGRLAVVSFDDEFIFADGSRAWAKASQIQEQFGPGLFAAGITEECGALYAISINLTVMAAILDKV